MSLQEPCRRRSPAGWVTAAVWRLMASEPRFWGTMVNCLSASYTPDTTVSCCMEIYGWNWNTWIIFCYIYLIQRFERDESLLSFTSYYIPCDIPTRWKNAGGCIESVNWHMIRFVRYIWQKAMFCLYDRIFLKWEIFNRTYQLPEPATLLFPIYSSTRGSF